MDIFRKIVQKLSAIVIYFSFFFALAALTMEQTYFVSSFSSEGISFLLTFGVTACIVGAIGILANNTARAQDENGFIEDEEEDSTTNNSFSRNTAKVFSYLTSFQVFMLCFHIIQYIGHLKLPTIFQCVNIAHLQEDVVVLLFAVVAMIIFTIIDVWRQKQK